MVEDCGGSVSNGSLYIAELVPYPQDCEKSVHEAVAVGLHPLVQGTRDVADQADGHRAETRLLLVLQGLVQEGGKVVHVLDEVVLQSARNGTDRGEYNIGDTGLRRNSGQDLKQHLHDAVGLGLDLGLESLNNSLESQIQREKCWEQDKHTSTTLVMLVCISSKVMRSSTLTTCCCMGIVCSRR